MPVQGMDAILKYVKENKSGVFETMQMRKIQQGRLPDQKLGGYIMKRLLALAVVLCMTLMLFAGCGTKDTTQDQPAPADNSTEEGTKLTTTADVTLELDPNVDYTQGDKVTLTAATGVVWGNPIQLSITKMNEVLTEVTNGRITFDEHHNSALGSERELLEQESVGMVDIVGGGSQVAYNFVPACGLFDLPYLFTSNEHAKAVLASDIGADILKQFEGTGIKALGWLNCGWRLKAVLEILPRISADHFGAIW